MFPISMTRKSGYTPTASPPTGGRRMRGEATSFSAKNCMDTVGAGSEGGGKGGEEEGEEESTAYVVVNVNTDSLITKSVSVSKNKVCVYSLCV